MIPAMLIHGRIGPSGILKFLGAFGSLYLNTRRSIFAVAYDAIQNTEPTWIRKLILSDEFCEIHAQIRIPIVIIQQPIYGTLFLFIFPKNCGIRFVWLIPAKISESPCTVEFCVLTTASADTMHIHI